MEQQFNNVFRIYISIVVIFMFAFKLVCLVYYGPDPEKHYASSARYVRVKIFPKSVESWMFK